MFALCRLRRSSWPGKEITWIIFPSPKANASKKASRGRRLLQNGMGFGGPRAGERRDQLNSPRVALMIIRPVRHPLESEARSFFSLCIAHCRETDCKTVFAPVYRQPPLRHISPRLNFSSIKPQSFSMFRSTIHEFFLPIWWFIFDMFCLGGE